jgi:hypothetical protein
MQSSIAAPTTTPIVWLHMAKDLILDMVYHPEKFWISRAKLSIVRKRKYSPIVGLQKPFYTTLATGKPYMASHIGNCKSMPSMFL